MIIKKIKASSSTPKATYIRDLTNYICAPHLEDSTERVCYAGARGFLSVDFKGRQAEMIALTADAVRCGNTVDHWIVSWREAETPASHQVERFMDVFMAHMEMAAHQVIYAVHADTTNRHLHLALNRVHPQTLRPIFSNAGFDHEVGHQVIALIEHEQGWKSEANALFQVTSDGHCVRTHPRGQEGKIGVRSADLEQRAGVKSVRRVAAERAGTALDRAVGWADFHNRLFGMGLIYRRCGRGAVFVFRETAVKASAVGRRATLPCLEARWGPFTAPNNHERIELFIAGCPVEPLKRGFPLLARYVEEREQWRIVRNRERVQFRRSGGKEALPGLEKRRPFPDFEMWLRVQEARPDLADRWRYRNHPAPQASVVGVRPHERISSHLKEKKEHERNERKRRSGRQDRWRRLGNLFLGGSDNPNSEERYRLVGSGVGTARSRGWHPDLRIELAGGGPDQGSAGNWTLTMSRTQQGPASALCP